MVTKPAKEFTDSTGRRKVKGNMDIELAIDALELAPFIDHMVLFSGDGDFRSLIEAMQRRGVRCSVVSTISTQPPMVADELRRQADAFMDLAHLIPKIGRDPADRPERPPRVVGDFGDRERPERPAFRSGGLERRYGIRQAPPATAQAPDDDRLRRRIDRGRVVAALADPKHRFPLGARRKLGQHVVDVRDDRAADPEPVRHATGWKSRPESSLGKK